MNRLLDDPFIVLEETRHAGGQEEHQLRIDALVHLRAHDGAEQLHHGVAVFAEIGAHSRQAKGSMPLRALQRPMAGERQIDCVRHGIAVEEHQAPELRGIEGGLRFQRRPVSRIHGQQRDAVDRGEALLERHAPAAAQERRQGGAHRSLGL